MDNCNYRSARDAVNHAVFTISWSMKKTKSIIIYIIPTQYSYCTGQHFEGAHPVLWQHTYIYILYGRSNSDTEIIFRTVDYIFEADAFFGQTAPDLVGEYITPKRESWRKLTIQLPVTICREVVVVHLRVIGTFEFRFGFSKHKTIFKFKFLYRLPMIIL